MHPNLSFEQAPPISVPYRFFLTAPWFGAAAGLLLAWAGDEALASRWTAVSLALTHLLVVGFMLQAMLGALLQFIPVAAGGNVWRPRLLAGIAHPLLILAALLLVAAFLSGAAILFRLAGGLFLLVMGFYVAIVGRALFQTPALGNTILALRMAIVALALTVLLGTTLADAVSRGSGLPLVQWANVHAAWGLGGWALLLLAGVSYYVVPMFQLTPAYPERPARLLPVGLFLVLAVWSLQLGGAVAPWQQLTWLGGLLLAAGFAVMTLRLQQRRRRKVADATFWFFRGAMLSLLLLVVSAFVMIAFPDLGSDPRSAVWLGVLALPGLFVSVINGMLYKIVPFMNWLHLQKLCGVAVLPPNMRDMVPEAAMNGQLRLHFAALGLLLLAAVWPVAARVAGMAFAGSCLWLGWNLIGALRVYSDFKDRIPAAGANPAP
jgi:hypothetical protein